MFNTLSDLLFLYPQIKEYYYLEIGENWFDKVEKWGIFKQDCIHFKESRFEKEIPYKIYKLRIEE